MNLRIGRMEIIAAALIFAAAQSPASAGPYQAMRNAESGYVSEFYRSEAAAERPTLEPAAPSSDARSAERAFQEAMDGLTAAAEASRLALDPELILKTFVPGGESSAAKAKSALGSGRESELTAGGAGLNALLALAALNNPDIRSAFETWKATANQYEQTVYLDQLLYQYLSFTESLNIYVGPQKQKRMVQMDFPSPGMAAIKGRVVQKDVEIARQQHLARGRDVLTDVKLAYFDLLYMDESLAITQKNLELARQIEKVAEELYSTGMAAYSDLVKIAIRVDTLGTMLESMRNMRDANAVKMAKLLGLPETATVGDLAPPDDAPLGRNLPAIRKAALEQRQELKAMRLKIERMGDMIDMASIKLFPDSSLGLAYFQNREIQTLGSQASMPAFAVKSMGPTAKVDFAGEGAYIQELRDKKAAMEAGLAGMENMTISMADMNYSLYIANRKNAETYKNSILVKADNAFEALKTSYTSGERNFVDLLDSHRQLLDLTLAREANLRESRKGRALLEQTAGGPLQ